MLWTNPDCYHFQNQKTFYEGWYARVSMPKQKETFTIIFGLTNPSNIDGQFKGQGYVIVLNGSEAKQIHEDFSLSQVSVKFDDMDVRMGKTVFKRDNVYGEVNNGKDICSFSLNFAKCFPWGKRPYFSPMSYLVHFPSKLIETSWHITHLNSIVSGYVNWKGRLIKFNNMQGYMEKVWGTVFPQEWVWMQANSFRGRPKAAFSGSGGIVPLPFLNLGIRAYMTGYFDGKKFYEFSTHLGSLIKAEYELGRWYIDARKLGERMVVKAHCPYNSIMPLAGPTEHGVRPVAFESLTGTLEVCLMTKKGFIWSVSDKAVSDLAGVEVGGKKFQKILNKDK
ncbi:MAG: hypothetical protein HQK76_11770 [Desulfobacterales bacterium]|nr:hypothetical protein [Desulfobacterales bacterium]